MKKKTGQKKNKKPYKDGKKSSGQNQLAKSQKPAKKSQRNKHTGPYVHKARSIRYSNRDKMRMIPIGGLGEIGKNMTVFEYKNQAIIVDCGLKFPDDDMLGVDIVLPDFDYIKKNKKKIKGIIVTHGHEDHIGGIAYLLKNANIPVYATKLTNGLIARKLKEHGLLDKVELNEIKDGTSFKLGDFKIEPIHVNHSIADSVAFAIKTPVATVLHTGDFKVDFQPIDGKIIDLQRIAEYGSEGVDLLLMDSTNVEEPGYTPSEALVGETIESIFDNNKNRIIITTFASNIHRIQQIIDTAAKHNRKVSIIGRSMENIVEVARDLGYLKVPNGLLIKPSEMNNYKKKELVIITTGSQGEPMAALGRIANGEHPTIQVGPRDTIVISASPVPGNEKLVSEVINKLTAKGADVKYQKLLRTHVSGHGSREELKLLHSLVKPKFFVPVHGETRMLLHHANLAESIGMPKENIFILNNGEILEFDKKRANIIEEKQSADAILVDGLGVGDVGNIVLSDRRTLSEEGLFIVIQKIRKGVPFGEPEIISRGFVFVKESDNLIAESREEVKKVTKQIVKKNITDWSEIKQNIKSAVSKFLYKKTERRPMILPILVEV